jgi:hypothetical protein
VRTASRPGGPTGARFSADRRYRYALWRVWEPDLGLCNFVMLNPSTADESSNDPTIARCELRARAWGFGGLLATNLFAWCSTDPSGLRDTDDPVGPANDAAIAEAARGAAVVVCAWGARGTYLGRASEVLRMLGALGMTPRCLGLTRSGEPAHPLYLGRHLVPAPLASAQYVRPRYPTTARRSSSASKGPVFR